MNSEYATVAVPAKIDSSGFVTPALPVILSVTMSRLHERGGHLERH